MNKYRVKEITFTNSVGKVITINEFGTYFLSDRIMSSGVSTQVETMKAYGQHGQTYLYSLYDAQEFDLNFKINVVGLPPEEIYDLRQDVTNSFLPHLGEGVLTVEFNDNRKFLRKVSVDSTALFSRTYEGSNCEWQDVIIPLVANNPFWYTEDSVTGQLIAWNNLFEMFDTPALEFSTTPAFQFATSVPSPVFTNTGNFDAPVILDIYGACTNPKITNATTGGYIRVKKTMVATDHMRIDTTFGKKSVVMVNPDGSTTNIFNLLDHDSTFFNLVVGANSLQFTDDIGTPSATISVSYNNQYLNL